MSDRDGLIEGIAAVAAKWRDPAYERRSRAVWKTLDAENVFTEEALAFAVNQQMALATADRIEAWIAGRSAPRRRTVGVLNAGNIPLVGLQDFLAVVLTGHRYVGTISSKSPALLPAFVADLRERLPSLEAEFAGWQDVFASAGALIATGSDETLDWARQECRRHGISPERRLMRGHSFGVAVLGARETDDEYERLAEDALLHEGVGCRNVAIIWAPRGLPPDPLLEAFARFRAVFPAHESTPGRLAMQQAFLEAVDQAHAFGEGLEFLLSRGDPEEQQPGHVRWTEYDDLAEVNQWLEAQASRIQLVVASEAVCEHLTEAVDLHRLGDAQRPGMDWRPDGVDTVAFLTALGS